MLLSSVPLANWLRQLAGNLPLLALIEFIDVHTKLHVLGLNGAVPFWSWPVTPTGARHLLAHGDKTQPCSLDQAGRTASLSCIDGRYGDHYPCSAPTTVRLGLLTRKVDVRIANSSENLRSAGIRRQKLDFLHVTRQKRAVPLSKYKTNDKSIFAALKALQKMYALKFWIMSSFGWLCWTALLALSIASRLYIVAAYLLLMPLTGILIHVQFSGPPRQLLDDQLSPHARLIVATDSLNGSDWSAFHGRSSTVNALLNKPLHRDASPSLTTTQPVLRLLLRLTILAQWILALGSSTLQEWNALLLAGWIIFCTVVSTYVYPAEESARDWLRLNCDVTVCRVSAEFSSRRSMLSALVYLNPDTKDRCLSWIDPILARGKDREAWEKALLMYMDSGDCPEETKKMYWWKFILEGVKVGQDIQNALPRGDSDSTRPLDSEKGG